MLNTIPTGRIARTVHIAHIAHIALTILIARTTPITQAPTKEKPWKST